MVYNTSRKILIISGIFIILSCFFPWWNLYSEFIPNSGERSYALFLSNPFLDSFLKIFVIYTKDSAISDPNGILNGILDTSYVAPFSLMLAVIITLIGGIISLISFGKKKIALTGALLTILGVILYILFIATGTYPTGLSSNYFIDNNLNPLFGTYSRDVFWFFISGNTSDIFGIGIGLIISLISGLILLIGAFKK